MTNPAYWEGIQSLQLLENTGPPETAIQVRSGLTDGLYPRGRTRLKLVPISFKQLKEIVTDWHRHNRAPVGHKFSVGVADGERLCGVASVGRPVSRIIATREAATVEITRVCTDGTKNANSMLYGACWRAATALGYNRVITYIQMGETGAAGYVKTADCPAAKGAAWNSRADRGTYIVTDRERWEKFL